MDTTVLIGHRVTHAGYGAGTITSADSKKITVQFTSVGVKNLQFPQVFVSLLKIDDASLQTEILEEANRCMLEEENRRKKESAERQNKREQQEKEKMTAIASAAKTVRRKPICSSLYTANIGSKEPPRMYGDGIIGPETSFSTHADVLNTLFGFQYKHFQKAYKDLGNGYAVWFPNIAKKIGDQYLSSDEYWGWLNILSEDGTTITQLDNASYTHSGEGGSDKNKCLIFARFDNNRRYTFIGAFSPSVRNFNKEIRTRIGTVFDARNMKIIR